MEEIKIYKNDIVKPVYFIINMAQKLAGHSMYGSLSSKGDLIGGIFDRWINIIPEVIIFNKGILPAISQGKLVEIISDYYSYDPAVVGIAPDVIGLVINQKRVPFVKFNEGWTAVENAPQIEIKTFKKNQQMISLRNQGYDAKYLIMVESDYRVDYLVPFIDKSLFPVGFDEKMRMNDEAFVDSNKQGLLSQIKAVDFSSDEIGTIKLLTITKSKDFMDSVTFCDSRVSVQRIKNIEPVSRNYNSICENLSDFCFQTESGLYRFSENWYDGVENGITYIEIEKRSGQKNKLLLKTLDFFTDNISALQIVKRNKKNFYVKPTQNVKINTKDLQAGTTYKIELDILDRSGNLGQEYFLQKDLISFIPSKKEQLESELSKIIAEN